MADIMTFSPAQAQESEPAFRIRPHNLEAEQAVLGGILVDNEAFHRAAEFLTAEHFYEPVHARIWSMCAQRIGRPRRWSMSVTMPSRSMTWRSSAA
jgi:replicative DNA helicase